MTSKDTEQFSKETAILSPSEYIEINLIQLCRIVLTFYIKISNEFFIYKGDQYAIDIENVYLLPIEDTFLSTTFFYEKVKKSVGFKEINKGITCKALTLLYSHRLYATLLKTEDSKINFILIILTIGLLVVYGIMIYFMFFNGTATPEVVAGAPL